MREIRYAKVNNREIPVLLSNEKEALLAALAAGGAVVGLWDPERPDQDLSPARFLVENPEDADPQFLERVARRHLGLPWKICETDRLVIREIRGEDFTEIWENQIGMGFSTLEKLEAYTKHQYSFYGFGFWALAEKKTGDLIGVAGLTIPREAGDMDLFEIRWAGEGEELELGYHVFVPYRNRGYAKEACRAILAYGRQELSVSRVVARIPGSNLRSRKVAESVGFWRIPCEKTCQRVSESCILDCIQET